MTERLKLGEKIAYAFGDFGNNIICYMVNTYFLFFMTDMAKIPAAVAGTILLVARIWDAVNDPLMGSIADKTRTRWGSYRPYLLLGVVPWAVSVILCFTIFPNMSITGRIVYFFIFYFIYACSNTVVNVPYGSLSILMTDNSKDRTLLGAFRDWGANAAGEVLGLAAVPLLAFFVSKGASDTGSYTYTTVVMCVVGCICILITFLGTKERLKPDVPVKVKGVKQKSHFIEGVKASLKNRAIIMIFLICFFFVVFVDFRLNWTVYYCAHYLQNFDIIGTYMTIWFLVPLFGILLVPTLIKLIGKKWVMAIGGISMGLSGLIFLVGHSTFCVILSALFTGITMSFVTPVIWGCLPEASDYGEIKTGYSAPGVMASFSTLAMSFGGAFGGWFCGVLLGIIGYDEMAEVQAASVTGSIASMNVIMPIIMAVIVVIFSLKYPITPEMAEENTRLLAEKRKAAELG